MNFNLDQEIDRTGTNSLKWEFMPGENGHQHGDLTHPKHGRNRLLPMWVADMDFRCPPAVVAALEKRASQGIFGYTYPADPYFQAIIDWMKRRQGWTVEKEWIVVTQGIVPALNMLVRAFVAPGEKVLIQRPVYHQFSHAVENQNVIVVSNSLQLDGGIYRIDFDDLARKAADPAVKMAILCSPHNPVGRVWSAEELRQFGQICMDNDVLVVSDEIHGDLIFQGTEFVPYGTLGDAFLQKSIICTAPSKTFNLAGLKSSNLLVADPSLREIVRRTLESNGVFGINTFGLEATKAAYTAGDEWLAAVMAYVEANYNYMADFLEEHIPQLEIIPLQSTYLIWVDCRQLNLDPPQIRALFMEEANVFINDGKEFGPEGEGFVRFNLACPRSILSEALERLATVIQRLDPVGD